MIQFDAQSNTYKATLLPEYLEQIHQRNQGFYTVVNNMDMVEEIENYVQQVQGKYEYYVVLGIGGSALGTAALRDGLLAPEKREKLIIVDNIDPDLLAEVEEKIAGKSTLFMVVTKSGGTPETLSLYSYFRALKEAEGVDVKECFVFITDENKGYLREVANAEKIPAFGVPENIGGRFSVLTPVGLLPAALMGIDIRELLQGAQDMAKQFVSESAQDNMAYQLAAVQYEHMQTGHSNVIMMPYSQKLKTFGAWYAQLLAESTGKINENGDNTGLSPTSSLGVTDQHSQLQLYTQGPDDKQFCMIRVKEFSHYKEIPPLGDDASVAMLQGVSFGQLMNIEMDATIATLKELHRPTYMLTLDQVDAQSMGNLIMLFEGATAFLGAFLNINAFDQPGVERSKILTREYLS